MTVLFSFFPDFSNYSVLSLSWLVKLKILNFVGLFKELTFSYAQYLYFFIYILFIFPLITVISFTSGLLWINLFFFLVSEGEKLGY